MLHVRQNFNKSHPIPTDRTGEKLQVKFFFRHRRPEYNSIEEVFAVTLNNFSGNITYECVELPHSGAGLKAIWSNLKFARRHRGAINHITGDVHYIALATGRNTVLTIHDVPSAMKGSRLRRFVIRLLWFWFPALCARKITVISPRSKQELEHIVPSQKDKIVVIPNPGNPMLLDAAPGRSSEGPQKPVIFLLGTKPNKNLERTLEALSTLPVSVLILGQLSQHQLNLLKELQIDYENYFNLPFRAVAELYTRCDLVCFASLYEGFGVPIVEAQLAGRPVVTSLLEPMTWVAGDGACFVDPYNVTSIREGISKVLGDVDYRNDLIEKGKKNVARFDPVAIAGQYEALYAAIAFEEGRAK